MRLTNVSASVALERMWIYARQLSTGERADLQVRLLAGETVTYEIPAGKECPVDHTRLTPEQFPVSTVTEETF